MLRRSDQIIALWYGERSRSAAGGNLGIEQGSCPSPLYLDVRSLLFNERDATYNEQYKALC